MLLPKNYFRVFVVVFEKTPGYRDGISTDDLDFSFLCLCGVVLCLFCLWQRVKKASTFFLFLLCHTSDWHEKGQDIASACALSLLVDAEALSTPKVEAQSHSSTSGADNQTWPLNCLFHGKNRSSEKGPIQG